MNGLLYYAITLNADNMAGNIFLNFFILAIIEVPAGWLGGYLVDRTGRRWTQVAFFLSAVAAFVVAAAVVNEPGLSSLLIVSIIVAKYGASSEFLLFLLLERKHSSFAFL
jgi:OCT family organic cation transporter-like MFS transporter 4/5